MLKGEVIFYNGRRGYGFAKRDDGGADIFIHISGLADQGGELEQGQRVTFELGEDPRKGRPLAVNVKVI